MTVDPSEKLVAELKRISILLALNITKDQSQRQQIEFLANVGFQPREIAEILHTTPNTVHVTLSIHRKTSEAKQHAKKSLKTKIRED